VRWGDGATGNATEHLAAMTGHFPFLIDNYKNYDDKDPAKLQRMIHAVIEGTEKDRLSKDSKLKDSEDYLCTPIITGENYPGQDAASRARVVQLDWTGPIDLDKVTEAQKHVKDLNALGKAWCQWLSSDEGLAAMTLVASKFDETRTRYIKDAGDAINVGRLATNATIIDLVWNLIGQWMLTRELAIKHQDTIKEAISAHIISTREDVSESLDAEKFISWLRAEIEIGTYVIKDSPISAQVNHHANTIGYYRKDEGDKERILILPAIVETRLLPAWQKTTNGVRADKKSLYRQLNQRGYLEYNDNEKSYTFVRRVVNTNKRVNIFDWSRIMVDNEYVAYSGQNSPYWGVEIDWDDTSHYPAATSEVVAQNQDAAVLATIVTTATGQKDKEIIGSKKEMLYEISSSDSSSSSVEVVDSDLLVTTDVTSELTSSSHIQNLVEKDKPTRWTEEETPIKKEHFKKTKSSKRTRGIKSPLAGCLRAKLKKMLDKYEIDEQYIDSSLSYWENKVNLETQFPILSNKDPQKEYEKYCIMAEMNNLRAGTMFEAELQPA
jgi:hypothetical protein